MSARAWGWVIGLAISLGLLSVAFAQPAQKHAREVTLIAQRVPLSMADSTRERVGSLRFLGGLALRSEDPGFGGLSGLMAEPSLGGWRIRAITDQGDLFTARLVLDGEQLIGLDRAAIEPLVDSKGRRLSGKSWSDAESITRLPDGRVLVGFERRHRIQAYGRGLTGSARAFETPRDLSRAPSNGGLESLASWPDGRLLAITEQMESRGGRVRGFLRRDGRWTTLEWTPSARGFEPSDATVLPDGDLLVLERHWSARRPLKLSARILRVRGDSVRPGAILRGELMAELTAPLTAENFEGIAAFTSAEGRTRLLLVSDDNFSPLQRTLLLSFEVGN